MALSDYFLHHRDVIPASPSGRAKQLTRPGLLRRLLDELVARRLQHTEHEIARYLETTGGKITDTVEREIEERLYPHRAACSELTRTRWNLVMIAVFGIGFLIPKAWLFQCKARKASGVRAHGQKHHK
jgi:hypothetical protein